MCYSTVKIRKNVSQKEKKIEHINLVYCWGKQFLIYAGWIIENNLPQILCVVLEFLSNGEVLNCFSRHIIPKLTDLSTVSKKEQIRTVLTCPKLAKWISAISKMNNCSKWPIWNHCISSHLEAKNINFGQQVNITGRVPLCTPAQAVVMSLAHNYMTNLFISSYRGATVIKFGQ